VAKIPKILLSSTQLRSLLKTRSKNGVQLFLVDRSCKVPSGDRKLERCIPRERVYPQRNHTRRTKVAVLGCTRNGWALLRPDQENSVERRRNGNPFRRSEQIEPPLVQAKPSRSAASKGLG